MTNRCEIPTTGNCKRAALTNTLYITMKFKLLPTVLLTVFCEPKENVKEITFCT